MASVALLLYCIALVVWLRPDPWMGIVWGALIPLITIPFLVSVVRGSAHWTRALMPWAAGVAFLLVAVQSAILESRHVPNVGVAFTLLGLGLVGSVALFMSAYDRSMRAPAEFDDA